MSRSVAHGPMTDASPLAAALAEARAALAESRREAAGLRSALEESVAAHARSVRDHAAELQQRASAARLQRAPPPSAAAATLALAAQLEGALGELLGRVSAARAAAEAEQAACLEAGGGAATDKVPSRPSLVSKLPSIPDESEWANRGAADDDGEGGAEPAGSVGGDGVSSGPGPLTARLASELERSDTLSQASEGAYANSEYTVHGVEE